MGWSVNPTFLNCVFADNEASKAGGAIHVEEQADPCFTNCTFGNNTSPEGSSIYNKDTTGSLVNCVLLDSGTGEIVEGDGANTQLEYCNLPGGWEGEGNIDADPLFVDPENENYRLQLGSPCIDSASTTGPSNDLDGNPRPVDIPGIGRDGAGAFDMGAYEVQGGFSNSRSDINEDGSVNAHDLLYLLADWQKEAAR